MIVRLSVGLMWIVLFLPISTLLYSIPLELLSVTKIWSMTVPLPLWYVALKIPWWFEIIGSSRIRSHVRCRPSSIPLIAFSFGNFTIFLSLHESVIVMTSMECSGVSFFTF